MYAGIQQNILALVMEIIPKSSITFTIVEIERGIQVKHCIFISCLALLLCVCFSFASADQAPDMTLADLLSETQMLLERQIETHYEMLLAEEVYASYGLIDAINSVEQTLDVAQANYEMLSDIQSCDEWKARLTGFSDPYDPGYREDQVVLDRLEAILTVCGLQLSDYCFQVQRNIAEAAEWKQAVNWTCNLKVFEKGEVYFPHAGEPDIQIVLFGEDMKVVSFTFMPYNTAEEE